MTIKLSDVRYLLEQEVKEPFENQDVIAWSNQVNADMGVSINLPATAQINLDTVTMEYPEPAGLKLINRLWLQSERDRGIDKEFTWPYRRYNGKIILTKPFYKTDKLNVDYYKQLTYFTDISQAIDLTDQYAPLYVAYGLNKYYKLPNVMQRLGEAQARQEGQLAQGMYQNLRKQVIALYSLTSDPVVVKERW